MFLTLESENHTMKKIKIIGSLILVSIISDFHNPASASSINTDISELTGKARCEALATLSSQTFTDLEIHQVDYIDSKELIDAKTNRLNMEQLAAFEPYCRLTGYFEKRTGVDNLPYAIGFGLSLPDQWNGKFLFQGGGGLNGLIREPLGSLAAGDVPALFRGFAVATSDGGHQSDTVFNPYFFADQKALINFYYGAVEKSTHVALELISKVYQQDPQQNYFVGCSTGGREAMTMSQRAPELFDGIIVGAPARQTNYSELANLWSAKRLRKVSEDQNSSPFTPVQQQAIVNELLAQCDARDGLADGLLFDVVGCDFKTEKLLCQNKTSKGDCLNQQQVTALNEAFAGPRNLGGEQIYPGFYFDTGILATGERSIPGLLQAKSGPLLSIYMDEDFDVAKQTKIAKNFPLAGGNALLTNLTTFALNGSKIMFFHGVSDPWFSAKDTFEYYQNMHKDSGGSEKAGNWSQFYFVPGMGHCGGGEQALDQFDMLTSLDHWVTEQERPTSVIATGKSMPGISRPLCPYPQMPIYDGQGDSQVASSFVCKIPNES